MAHHSEKDIEQHVDVVDNQTNMTGSNTSSQDLGEKGVAPLIELSPAEEKIVMRKIDYRLIPLLTFLYLVAFIDRSNSEHIHTL
jgi:hypothetical protein